MQAPETKCVWTIQEWDVWEKLQKEKYLYVDPDLCNNLATWPDSYAWMREQMRRRIPGYGDHWPWWSYAQPKPDLRFWRHHLMQGQRYVRIELCLPASQVLISSLEAWVMAINQMYIAYTKAEYDNWEAETEADGINTCLDLLPEPYETRRSQSWEHIFDIPGLAAGGQWDVDELQATFEVLRLEDVQFVTAFQSVNAMTVR